MKSENQPMARQLATATFTERFRDDIEAADVNLRGVLAIVRHHWRLVASVVASTFLAVVVYVAVTAPVYTATVQLLLEPHSDLLGGDDTAQQPLTSDGINSLLESQLRIIESKTVLMGVVASEKLTTDPAFVSEGLTSKLFGAASEIGKGTFVRLVAATMGPAMGLNLTGMIKAIDDVSAEIHRGREPDALAAYRRLKRSISVSRGEKSLVIDVHASSRYAAKAAQLANAVAETYLVQQSQARLAAARELARSLEAQLPALSLEVQKAEIAVQRFRFEHNLAGASDVPSLATTEALAGLRNLERGLEASRTVYTASLLRARKAAEAANLDRAYARIISRADPPADRSWPLTGLLLVIGAVAGTGLGIGMALARDHFQERLYTKKQVEHGAGYPVIAVFPPLHLQETGLTPTPEGAFLRLRDSLHRNETGPRNNIVLMMPAGPTRGNLIVAVNLAATMAAQGERVLVISVKDGDDAFDAGPQMSLGTGATNSLRASRQSIVGFHTKFAFEEISRDVLVSAIDPWLERLTNKGHNYDLVILSCAGVRDDDVLYTLLAGAGQVIFVAQSGLTRGPDLRTIADLVGSTPTPVYGVMLHEVVFAQNTRESHVHRRDDGVAALARPANPRKKAPGRTISGKTPSYAVGPLRNVVAFWWKTTNPSSGNPNPYVPEIGEANIGKPAARIEHTGYCIVQDTLHLGFIRGIGHVYQQTVMDIHTKRAFVKVYKSKAALNPVDILNDRVMPFYNRHGIQLSQILSDGKCPKAHLNEYETFLESKGVQHSRARREWTKLIYAPFYRVLREEFYPSVSDGEYRTIEQLQADLDAWVAEYNQKRGQFAESVGDSPFHVPASARRATR